MTTFRADMHIHTCLSPCGELSMDPARVVALALKQGLDLLVITDHNTTGNSEAVMDAAQGTSLTVLPGCEVGTVEEVHLIAIFESLEVARRFQPFLTAHLSGANTPEVFGYQIVADAEGNFTDECTDFLMGGLSASASEVAREVKRMGGLLICAHIDRKSFSVISQLGFIPGDLSPDAVEVTYPGLVADFAAEHGAGLPVVTASDAHFPEEIGRWTTLFEMEEASFNELAMALHGEKGRHIAGYDESRGVLLGEAI